MAPNRNDLRTALQIRRMFDVDIDFATGWLGVSIRAPGSRFWLVRQVLLRDI
jgi:hypothetical protein